jgi:hypothetical protein
MKRFATALILPSALFLSGCVFDSSSADNSGGSLTSSGEKVFVVGHQWSSNGGEAALDRFASDTAALELKTWTSSDVVLDADSANGILYTIQRSNGVVTGYKASDLSQKTLEVNVGSDANPYAVASLSGKLWVACYGSSYLKAVSLSTQSLVDSIDLSAYADITDKQKVPQAFAVHAWNGKLAVVLGRLNGWVPGDSTLVLVIDPSTKAVEKRIALPWKNGYGAAWSGNLALVACVGAWAVNDGGLVEVDLSSGAATPLVSDATAGGDVTSAVFGPSGAAFVGVSDLSYATSVWSVDLSSAVLSKVSGSLNVGAFAWNGTSLWLGNASGSAPSVVQATSTGTVLKTRTTTLTPGSIAILP